MGELYLKFLSSLYFIGFGLHLADLFDLRLNFSEMSLLWQSWIVFLTIADFITAVGLWRKQVYGVVGFHVVAVAQLFAYSIFSSVFGSQIFLVTFHSVTLLLFHVIRYQVKGQEPP